MVYNGRYYHSLIDLYDLTSSYSDTHSKRSDFYNSGSFQAFVIDHILTGLLQGESERLLNKNVHRVGIYCYYYTISDLDIGMFTFEGEGEIKFEFKCIGHLISDGNVVGVVGESSKSIDVSVLDIVSAWYSYKRGLAIDKILA
jgi:hypothetical protein